MFVIGLLLFPIALLADNDKGGNKNQPPEKREISLGKTPAGHLAPSSLTLSIEIYSDEIVVLPAEWYSEMTITVTSEESGETWGGFISVFENSIPFTATPGTYTIHCTTLDGRELYGTLSI